jgi:hypothetical protein
LALIRRLVDERPTYGYRRIRRLINRQRKANGKPPVNGKRVDSDGDGTVSLQEFQAAHERIFKAMDTDKDGTLTLEEIQAFMRGTGKSAPKEHEHD